MNSEMSSYKLVTERYIESEVLGRRIRLDKVDMMTSDDLHKFRVEVKDAIQSMTEQEHDAMRKAKQGIPFDRKWMINLKFKKKIYLSFKNVIAGALSRHYKLERARMSADQRPDEEQVKIAIKQRSREILYQILVDELGHEKTVAIYATAKRAAELEIEKAIKLTRGAA